jgi:hypothetical protein
MSIPADTPAEVDVLAVDDDPLIGGNRAVGGEAVDGEPVSGRAPAREQPGRREDE